MCYYYYTIVPRVVFFFFYNSGHCYKRQEEKLTSVCDRSSRCTVSPFGKVGA